MNFIDVTSEVKFILKQFTALIATKFKSFAMSTYVTCENSFGLECLSAFDAFIVMRLTVNIADVTSEDVLSLKRLFALIAFKVIVLVVNDDVPRQMKFAFEHFAAFIAFKIVNLSMYNTVAFEIEFILEYFAALDAANIIKVTMDRVLVTQVNMLGLKLLFAHSTFELALVTMRDSMALQIKFSLE